MGNTYFFTGFPGFIATNLIKTLINDGYEIDHIFLLVLPEMKAKAQKEMERMSDLGNLGAERLSLVIGDITKVGLDLSPDLQRRLEQEVTHVFHLAAIYDLAVPKDLAYKVNVVGTGHVNNWLQSLSNLKRYVYFSTSYVAGTREGRILETELEMNQTFKNHYESTKYEAEVLVKGVMETLPTTIIRPGIVVGDSKTGETVKFDGPYFMLNFLDRLRTLPVLPYLGSGEAEGNFVPVDYILKATLYLGHLEAGVGKTYQLTDPKPYKINDVYRMLMKALLGREPKGKIPLSWARMVLSSSRFRKWVRTEKEALDYFTCKAEYDCSEAQRDLKESGIVCPDFKEVIPAMVAFYNKHKNDESKQLKIT